MNVALNMLKPNPVETPASPGKTVNTKPKSAQKPSFSDSLNNAVSQSSKSNAQEKNEQLNPAGSDTKPDNAMVVTGGLANLVIPNLAAATGQSGNDLSALSGIDITESNTAETTQPSQDMLVTINNSIVAAQMMIPAQPVTTEPTVMTDSTNTSVTAITGNVSEAPAVFGHNPKPLADSSGILNSQIKQNPDLLRTSLPQPHPSQEQPAPVKNENAVLSNKPVQADSSSIPLTTSVTESVLTTQTVFENKTQNVTAKTDKSINGMASEPIQQAVDPTPVPIVNQQDKSPKQQFDGRRQKESSSDQPLCSQTRVVQDISADTVDTLTPHMISPGVESLMNKNNTLVTTAVNETQQQANQLTDVHQVVDQIVEQTKIITKPQNSEMIIKLKPEHLGELTLKVVIDNGMVKASFHSDNAEVRSIIEASLPQLKQDLTNNGLKVENVGVYAGLSQFSPNHDQERSSRQQLIKLNNKKLSDDFVEAIENDQGNFSRIGVQSGVDYRI